MNVGARTYYCEPACLLLRPSARNQVFYLLMNRGGHLTLAWVKGPVPAILLDYFMILRMTVPVGVSRLMR